MGRTKERSKMGNMRVFFANIRAKGALGFRNLHIVNIALLGKLTWKLHTQPKSLIGRILKARYFLNTECFDARLGPNPSYTWKGIHTTMDLVKRGM